MRGVVIAGALTLSLGASCAEGRRSELRVEGAALGTTYSVRVAGAGEALTRRELETGVARTLERVDALMSTYREDSELVRFNRYRGTDWVAVSRETAGVARAARELAARSDGAFDPTVGPLVRLWGFGPSSLDLAPPEADQLRATRAAVGIEHLHVREEPPALRKDQPELELDLSGIAKGHAVDAIAAQLRRLGAADFLVEIGGEIRAEGTRPRGDPWLVEIEDPYPRTGERPARVALRDAAIATSGPHRNFRVHEGERLSHLIDPRSGRPVAGALISVSVIAPSAMQADGWATALLVAGPREGWELAEREALAALFVSAPDGASRRRATRSFDTHWSDRSQPEGR